MRNIPRNVLQNKNLNIFLLVYIMSGLPVNTFSQAAEYRKRYLATLALQAQNDAYNLQANQVYKQTGQPARPPDTRTTTEKMGDIEKLKVDLRSGLMQLTDGTNANETIEQLTPDEVMFATQQLPSIVTDLKPKFARGVPANALVSYIRALRRKFLATNGVSFTAQEATAQQILNAVQAGVAMMGAPGGPFAPGGGPGGSPSTIGSTPSTIPPGPAPTPASGEFAPIETPPIGERMTPVRPVPRRPPSGLPISTPESMPSLEEAPQPQEQPMDREQIFDEIISDPGFQQAAASWGPPNEDDWDAYPVAGGFHEDEDLDKALGFVFLRKWAEAQTPEIQSKFNSGWKRISASVSRLKQALTPGVEFKLAQTQELTQEEPNPFDTEIASQSAATTQPTETTGTRPSEAPVSFANSFVFQDQVLSPKFTAKDIDKIVNDFLKANPSVKLMNTSTKKEIRPEEVNWKSTQSGLRQRPVYVNQTNILDIIREVKGRGVVAHGRPENRVKEPASRFPTGRHILGYGLQPMVKQSKKKAIHLDITKGLAYEPAPTFVPFGKYIVNPSKLSSGLFDMRTLNGGVIKKYPSRKLSPALTKILNRIIGGRLPDSYDVEEMELDDQEFLFNLANDAKINDRLKIPTPKRSKEDEEENRFEILKGQIVAGNDSKELVKEFKRMLVKFSNEGRINKNEAREILLDLTAAGH